LLFDSLLISVFTNMFPGRRSIFKVRSALPFCCLLVLFLDDRFTSWDVPWCLTSTINTERLIRVYLSNTLLVALVTHRICFTRWMECHAKQNKRKGKFKKSREFPFGYEKKEAYWLTFCKKSVSCWDTKSSRASRCSQGPVMSPLHIKSVGSFTQ